MEKHFVLMFAVYYVFVQTVFCQLGETCVTVDGGVGYCISRYNSQEYPGRQAAHILGRDHCGIWKVCCPLQGLPNVPSAESTTTTSTTTTPAAEVRSSKTVLGNFKLALPDPPDCGVIKALSSRVVGGDDAKLGEFPWMALLGYKNGNNPTPSWMCGGSLISSRHVLTAAHCIHGMEKNLSLVRLGELDYDREDDGATPLDVLIKKVVKHEDYNKKTLSNDIGILLLTSDVQFTDFIIPICIPKDSELRARSFERYNPQVAGWGHTQFGGSSTTTHLQVVTVPVVSNEFCAQAYSAYKAQKIDERVLCAGYKKGGKDACQGDSGGPLMQSISKTNKAYYYQIGVVSFGHKCAEEGFPGVYTRVTHFVSWIEEQVLGHTSDKMKKQSMTEVSWERFVGAPLWIVIILMFLLVVSSSFLNLL